MSTRRHEAGDQPERGCPIPKAHGRLRHAHRLWHQTLESYPDPDEFCMNLNSTLQALRTVTWLLHKEKRAIPDFDTWYAPWEERMKNDELMRWLVDARNHVEKRGDLNLNSTARVGIRADWLFESGIEFEVPPLLSPAEMAADARRRLSDLQLPPVVRKEGLLKIERRWVAASLPDHELLDVLAHGYGFLATILEDAHRRCGRPWGTVVDEGDSFRLVATEHLGGRLPCMVTTADMRAVTIHIASGEVAEVDALERVIEPPDEITAERLSGNYLLSPGALAPEPGEDLLDHARKWALVARRMLAADGTHVTLAVLFTPEGEMVMRRLAPADQGDKYLLMDRLAREVEITGANGLIFITEVWMAAMPKSGLSPTMLRASERPDRTEGLSVVAATADGRTKGYLSPFSRRPDGRIVLGAMEELDNEIVVFLAPIQDVWRRRREAKARFASRSST